MKEEIFTSEQEAALKRTISLRKQVGKTGFYENLSLFFVILSVFLS
jgi:hypothetical protein